MKKAILVLSLWLTVFTLQAQQNYQPAKENLQARAWFQDAKFGMFIHWGASSVLGHGEWVMHNRNIKVEDYHKLQDIFNPTRFDAEKWVSAAKNAGMKYITFITRHHDSFSNWDTQQSDWKITNTPYGKDALKQLEDECHKQGIKLFAYYSLLDWYRSDYPYETGKTGKGTGRTAKSDYNSYLRFMKAQLTELLTNYGEISGIWFDGHWDQLDNDHDKTLQSKIDWRYDEIYSLIHSLQPQCLIGNNHHLTPLAGEDFQMFERDLPGENKGGLSGQEVSPLPLETCETINGSWGFNITDHTYKSTKELVSLLVRASGYGANLLLNVGPMPNGVIQPEFVTRLEEVGNWLKQYGETVYGTRGGAIKPQPWGAVTEKGNKIYIHVLDKKEDALFLQLPKKIKSAQYFINGKKVNIKSMGNNNWMIDLKDYDNNALDNVIEISL